MLYCIRIDIGTPAIVQADGSRVEGSLKSESLMYYVQCFEYSRLDIISRIHFFDVGYVL